MAKKVTAAKDAKPPSASDVATLLGKSHAQFQVLTGRPGAVCEWRRYSKTAPWVVKVRDGDRTLFYIAPKPGHFEVTVVLGERAVEAALAGRVGKKLHASIREAKPRGVPSLTRTCACDVPRARNYCVPSCAAA